MPFVCSPAIVFNPSQALLRFLLLSSASILFLYLILAIFIGALPSFLNSLTVGTSPSLKAIFLLGIRSLISLDSHGLSLGKVLNSLTGITVFAKRDVATHYISEFIQIRSPLLKQGPVSAIKTPLRGNTAVFCPDISPLHTGLLPPNHRSVSREELNNIVIQRT